MRFIETPVFTRVVAGLLDDEDYRALQEALLLRPTIGPVIPGGGGLRKVRWALPGRGKRGGCRVIYYWDEASETYYMLYAYDKAARRPDPAAAPDPERPRQGGVPMTEGDFDDLATSIRQAGQIRRGEAEPSRVFEHAPMDVRAIRGAWASPRSSSPG